MSFLHRVWSDEKGEDMTEYALIVGLIAIAAIGGMVTLASGFNGWYSNLASFIGSLSPSAS